MFMLSPRSYITGAFDVLYNPLTSYIHKRLSENNNDWWTAYVLKAEGAMFRDSETHQPLPTGGDLKTLREYFDEYNILKLVMRREIKKLFPEEIVGMFAILLGIRSDWEQREIRTTSQADRAITQMISFAKLLNSPSAAEKLSEIAKKMKTDEATKTKKRR